MNITYMESIHGVAYKSKVVLAKELGISPGTVNNRCKEIKEEILKGRYPEWSVINDGGLKLINYLVYIDYSFNRERLREPNLRKYVEPFNAYEIAKSIGYYQ